MYLDEVAPKEEIDEVWLAEEISKKTRELNGLFETARKQGLVVQVSVITIESVPGLRLDAVYKRLDKPLILRV
jgi:hypothetical protein